jgi:hypothetical protein
VTAVTIILGASAVLGAACVPSGAGEGSGSGQEMEKIYPNTTNSRYNNPTILTLDSIST